MSRPVPNVFPSSDPGPVRLALIGEAPGGDEVAMGYPFAGKSGWWLNQWLSQAGLSRYSCFVGNVSQCRPGPNSNEFDLLEWNGPEIQSGIAQLRCDLAKFQPHCILALGNAALHLLRHGNEAPPKSQKLGLFQWPSRVGTWRGSLGLSARSFDVFEAADVRVRSARRAQLLYGVGGVESRHAPSFAIPEIPLKVERASEAVTAVSSTQSESSASPDSTPFASLPSPQAASLQHPTSAGGERPHGTAAEMTAGAPLGALEASTGLPLPLAASERGESASGCSSAQSSGNSLMGTPLSSGPLPSAAPFPPTWKYLATYHPASTFREPSFTYPLVTDIKRAVAEASSATLDLPRRDIAFNLTIDEIESRCEAIRAARRPVAHDIEGGLGGLQCCSFATTPHDAFVVDLMERDWEYSRRVAAVANVLEDPAVPKVLWNAMYERAIWQAVASVTLRNYHDGMLAWWERFSELPKGLDFVASILTREPVWYEGIGWDKRTGLPKITGPAFWLYNGIDSCVTLEIWEHPLIRAVAESRAPVRFAL